MIATQRSRCDYWLEDVYNTELGEGDRDIVWPDSDPPTMAERATTSSTLAQRDAALIAAAVITPEESRRRLEGDEEVLLPVFDADADEQLPDLGDVLARLQAEGAIK